MVKLPQQFRPPKQSSDWLTPFIVVLVVIAAVVMVVNVLLLGSQVR